MKWKLFSLAVVLGIISVVMFSMENLNVSDGINLPMPLSDGDFVVQSNNTLIELDSKLETEEQLMSASYADERHTYNTFLYQDFSISTTPPNDIIWRINILTSVPKTSRGISIGSTLADVFEKYGVLDKNLDGFYSYHHNGKSIMFWVDSSDIITEISLQII